RSKTALQETASFFLLSLQQKKSVHLNLRRDQNERSNLIIQFWLLSDKREFNRSTSGIADYGKFEEVNSDNIG
ncbi:MAG: hypothetical protein ILA55_01995, partial [Erysipelotrichaceae bacterium]|nr:hypothetical protein [Erysipelotrichaceae bacterium]